MAFAEGSKGSRGERFVVLLDSEEHELELCEVHDPGAEITHEVIVDGAHHRVDAVALGGKTWSMIVEGRSYEVDVVADDADPQKLSLVVRGVRIPLEVFDERHLRMRAVGGGLEVGGPAEIVAPMPGKVVKVLVQVGEQVTEGDGLLVVEAMKMENELKAPREGTVREILVAAGDTVEGAARLMVLE